MLALVALLSTVAVRGQTQEFADPEVARAYELLKTQQIEASLGLLRSKLQIEPDDAEALYVAGLATAAQGRAEEAAGLLERSVAASPDSRAARELGLLRGSQGRLRDCLRLLRGWFATHPGDLEAGTAAAFCALEAHRADDARALLAQLPGDLPAVRLLEGRLLLFESRPQAALDVLTPALNSARGSMELDVRRLMAKAHLGLGQASKAVDLLADLDRTPQLATYLAEAQYQLGDVAAARSTLEPWARRALTSGRTDLGAEMGALLRDYGRTLLQAGDPSEAVPCLELATRVSPGDKRPWRLLGQALAAVGRRQEAESALEQFRRLASEEPAESVKDQRASLGLRDPTQIALREASELAQLGRVDEALELLQQEARLVPDDARPQLVAARILLAQGRPEEALGAARTAESVEPDSPLPEYEQGRALAALGRTPEAAEAFGSALAKNPNYPDALVELTALEMARGETNRARQLLEKALTLEPGHAKGRRLQRRLSGEQ